MQDLAGPGRAEYNLSSRFVDYGRLEDGLKLKFCEFDEFRLHRPFRVDSSQIDDRTKTKNTRMIRYALSPHLSPQSDQSMLERCRAKTLSTTHRRHNRWRWSTTQTQKMAHVSVHALNSEPKSGISLLVSVKAQIVFAVFLVPEDDLAGNVDASIRPSLCASRALISVACWLG